MAGADDDSGTNGLKLAFKSGPKRRPSGVVNAKCRTSTSRSGSSPSRTTRDMPGSSGTSTVTTSPSPTLCPPATFTKPASAVQPPTCWSCVFSGQDVDPELRRTHRKMPPTDCDASAPSQGPLTIVKSNACVGRHSAVVVTDDASTCVVVLTVPLQLPPSAGAGATFAEATRTASRENISGPPTLAVRSVQTAPCVTCSTASAARCQAEASAIVAAGRLPTEATSPLPRQAATSACATAEEGGSPVAMPESLAASRARNPDPVMETRAGRPVAASFPTSMESLAFAAQSSARRPVKRNLAVSAPTGTRIAPLAAEPTSPWPPPSLAQAASHGSVLPSAAAARCGKSSDASPPHVGPASARLIKSPAQPSATHSSSPSLSAAVQGVSSPGASPPQDGPASARSGLACGHEFR
mmetsp:Transcript_14067/g.38476  ORF Transcript_14067/g.38476 Transcript_14067/m.38476 type:complete len:411 (+) Transcript_14067:1179-2411(+)